MSIVLRPISPASAAAVIAARAPDDGRVEADYPTEFSIDCARDTVNERPLGAPLFCHRADDDVVVGELGCAHVAPGTIEIGYAIVASCWGRGYATDAVRALIRLAREHPEIERIRGNTPLDRPASGRVLTKAGFRFVGETDDEHDGVAIRVHRWEFDLATSPATVVLPGTSR